MKHPRRHIPQPASAPELPPIIIKQLGSLWVLNHFMKRLRIAEIIDGLCPTAPQAELTHGQVIAAMVANRLTSPQPLVHVHRWAQEWAVPEVFGITAGLLNDDRLGRALDAIVPYIDDLKGFIAWSGMDAFGVEAALFHWDFTSLSFFGAYDEDQSEAGPQVTYGHSKARRPDLKQLMVGLAASSDCGIPFNPTVLDGAAAEVSQVAAAMKQLQLDARRDEIIVVGDTKLISAPNIVAAAEAGVCFCAPGPASAKLAQAFRVIPAEDFKPLAYTSERESQKPEGERTVYLGCERPWVVTDAKSKKSVTVRALFVISSEERDACRKNRARQMEKAEAALRKIAANLGGRFYTTPEEVRLKAEKALRECRVADLYQVSTGGKEKQPTFAWQRNAEAIAAAEALDGFYVLMANLPADPYDPSALLQLYKGQAKVERRFGNLKGPLGVSPLLFKNNERLAALVFVTYLALLVFSLIEREARKAAEPTGGKVRGYYPENREVRPTGANLLQVFRWLAVAVATGPNGPSPLPPALNQGQQLVHQLLDVPHPFST